MWLPVEAQRKKFKCQISTEIYDDLCPESRFVGDSSFFRGISERRKLFVLAPNWSPTMVAVIGTSKDVGLCLPGDRKKRFHHAVEDVKALIGRWFPQQERRFEIWTDSEWNLNRFFVIRFVFFVSRRAAPTSPWSSRWAVSCRSARSGDVVTFRRRNTSPWLSRPPETTSEDEFRRGSAWLSMSWLQKVELSRDVNNVNHPWFMIVYDA